MEDKMITFSEALFTKKHCIKINLKTFNELKETVMTFEGYIISSTDTTLKIGIDKNEDLKSIFLDHRFIIGDIYPRAYKITGINEYPTQLDIKNLVIFTLQIDPFMDDDDLFLKIANFLKKDVKKKGLFEGVKKKGLFDC